MRLVCPSCEAKYEVPEDAIPDTGRDVQCANCGHSWFQMRPRPPGTAASVAEPQQIAAETASPEIAATPVPATESVPETMAHPRPDQEPDLTFSTDPTEEVPDPSVEPEEVEPEEAEPETVTGGAAQAGTRDDPGAQVAVAGADTDSDFDLEAERAAVETSTQLADPPSAVPEADGSPGPAAYAVDEGVLAILREEAEREALARRADENPLETQPDLGIEAARKPRNSPVSAPLAESRAKPSARRDLLPDVEEINSTLRPSEQPADEEGRVGVSNAQTREARSGFRSGFLLVMTLSILGAAVYIGAPRLADMIPSLADPLMTYVKAVDGLRQSLDGLMRSATLAINGE